MVMKIESKKTEISAVRLPGFSDKNFLKLSCDHAKVMLVADSNSKGRLMAWQAVSKAIQPRLVMKGEFVVG